MIGFYGLLAGNKARTEVLPLAIAHYPHTVTHLCNQFNHVFAVLISMPRFESNNLYQTRPKIKVLLEKISKFLSAGCFAPRPPLASGGWAPPPYQKQQPSHYKFLALHLASNQY